MKKLQLLTATAGILLTLAGPTLAAQRAISGADAYASANTADRSGAYYYGPQNAQGRDVQSSTPATQFRYAPAQYDRGQSQPFSDRPYGAPDNW